MLPVHQGEQGAEVALSPPELTVLSEQSGQDLVRVVRGWKMNMLGTSMQLC